MDQNNPQGEYSVGPEQPQESFVVKKQNRAATYLALAGVAVVVVGATLFLLGQKYIWGKTPSDRSTAPTENAENIAPPLPTPTGAIHKVDPWPEAAAADLTQAPPLPTKEELDQAYRKIRTAVSDRDFSAIKSLVSAERVWHIEHPKRIIGSMQTEGQYYEIAGTTGESNFVHAPYAILFDAPPQDKVVPQEVTRKEVATRPDIYLTDPKTGITEMVHMTPWKYAVDLVYKTASGYADPGTGHVTFVYDSGRWAFQGQGWELTHKESIEDKGDTVPAGITVQNISVDEKGNCTPPSGSVHIGDAVRWNALTGMIYTILPSTSHWDSGFLYKDAYTKKFDQPGTYTYVVQQPPRDPSVYTKCSITVEP